LQGALIGSGYVNTVLSAHGGNVGIGDTTPSYTLDVNGAINATSSNSDANLGTELVTNGTFDSDLTGWAGANWAYDAGEASHTAGAATALTQSISVTNGTAYQCVFTITSRTAGNVTFSINGVYIYDSGSTPECTWDGTYTRSLVANTTGTVTLAITPASDFDGDIDNVSVKAISETTPQFYSVDDSGSVAFQIRADDGLYNTFVGDNAGRMNTTGNYNTFLGYEYGYFNTTGYSNMFIGFHSGHSNKTGGNNLFVVASAGTSNTTGYFNTFVGGCAGYYNTQSTCNVFFGVNTGFSNTTGNDNLFFGMQAGYYNTTGSSNLALGSYAGMYIADGATPNQTTGTSIYVGVGTKASASGVANEIAIGNSATGQGSNTIMLGNSSVTGLYCYDTSISSPSDRRIKTDITPIPTELALAFVNALEPVTFHKLNPADWEGSLKESTYKDRQVTEYETKIETIEVDEKDALSAGKLKSGIEERDGKYFKQVETRVEKQVTVPADPRPEDNPRLYAGLIAQDVETAMAANGISYELVPTSNNGLKAVRYTDLIPALIAAVKELSAKNVDLQKRIDKLEGK